MIFDNVQKVYIGNQEVTKALFKNIEIYTSAFPCDEFFNGFYISSPTTGLTGIAWPVSVDSDNPTRLNYFTADGLLAADYDIGQDAWFIDDLSIPFTIGNIPSNGGQYPWSENPGVQKYCPDPWLYVYLDDRSLYSYYENNKNVVVNNISDNCNPLYLIGGTVITDLTFNSCGNTAPFLLNLYPGYQSLTNLSFNNCGLYDTFGFSTQYNLPALTNLSFNSCGDAGFYLSSTAHLTELIQLSFDSCGTYTTFQLLDMSGLLSLTTLIITNCGFGVFILPTTSGTVGTLDSLTYFSMTNCGPPDLLFIQLVVEALDAAGNLNGTFITDSIEIDFDEQPIINLQNKGWNVVGPYW
jgi:hypothetical protein